MFADKTPIGKLILFNYTSYGDAFSKYSEGLPISNMQLRIWRKKIIKNKRKHKKRNYWKDFNKHIKSIKNDGETQINTNWINRIN